MLTLDKIQTLNINETVAREAYTQVDKRLQDQLEQRKSAEQKATSLFSAYVTIALTLFGIGGTFFKDAALITKAWPFFAAGTIFVAGATAFLSAIKAEKYGFLGSSPDMWLREGTIDSQTNTVPTMLAYIVFHHQERIVASEIANAKKLQRIHIGMWLGLAGAATFGATLANVFWPIW